MLVAALLLLALPACQPPARSDREEAAAQATGGDPARGRAAIAARGCGSCHTVPGIPGADANVGPSLDRIGSRVYVGGVLVNTPDNLVRWLKDPPAVDAKTAMPALGLGDDEARDVAAYLYTLR